MTPSDIKQALEGGETGRELDAAIAVYFGLVFEDGEDAFGYKQYSRRDADGTIVSPGPNRLINVPKLTTSVDAALALAGEVYTEVGVLRVVSTAMDALHHYEWGIEKLAAAILIVLINTKEKANA